MRHRPLGRHDLGLSRPVRAVRRKRHPYGGTCGINTPFLPEKALLVGDHDRFVAMRTHAPRVQRKWRASPTCGLKSARQVPGALACPAVGRSPSRRSLVAAVTAVALSELASFRGSHAVQPTPGFLTRELGAPSPSAPLVRAPSRGVSVAIHHGGYTLATPAGTIGLTADVKSAQQWTTYRNGASRTTALGSETVAVGPTAPSTSRRSFIARARRPGGGSSTRATPRRSRAATSASSPRAAS